MYQAELRGKLSHAVQEAEDILTSNVFSFYLYADRLHLQRLLNEVAGLRLTLQEAEEAVFQFWPLFPDGTEPDLVLEVGRYYVLIEAKLHSGYGDDKEDEEGHQLLREARAGRKAALGSGRDFVLLTVTDESVPRESIYGRLRGADRASWRWTNWGRVGQLLETGPPTGRMGDDLRALLFRKGLRHFDGFTGQASELHSAGCVFFDATTSQAGRFAGFQRLLGPNLLVHHSQPVFWVEPHR